MSNLLIGKQVEYTNREQIKIGTIMDSIMMIQNDSKNPNQAPVVISGYMIVNSEDQQIYPVAYWRVTHIL